MGKTDRPAKRYYPAIWLSDMHLGYRQCKAEYLLDFLKSTRSDVLYLVGDVIDMWAMKRGFHWPKTHHEVLKKIVKIAQKGKTRVIYIPGNHDEPCRDLVGNTLLGVELHRNFIHQCSDGRRFLLCHGDEFENAIRHSRLNRLVGDFSYDLLLWLNRWGNRVRAWFGMPYWSLATYIKNRVDTARRTIEIFEQEAAAEARRRGLDGVICGHIHQPEIRKIDGVLYCNDGDWTESCTALVENSDGWLEILHWSEARQSVKSDREEPDQAQQPILVLPRVS